MCLNATTARNMLHVGEVVGSERPRESVRGRADREDRNRANKQHYIISSNGNFFMCQQMPETKRKIISKPAE